VTSPEDLRIQVARDLRRRLRGDVEFDDVTLQLYATDAGLNQVVPLGVVSPRDTEDVVRLVEYCAGHGISIVPRGAGSGLAGGAVGAGIQVDFTRYMNRILEVAPDGSWARVQPGVVMATLNEHGRNYGTFFAPDPSSENYCSLGGMIGTNSSGARSVAYGGTIDHVLALQVVLADASVLEAESRPVERLVGPELVGPEQVRSGTLAATLPHQVLPLIDAHQGVIRDSLPCVVKNCSGYRVEAILEDTPSGQVAHPQRLFVGAEGTLGLVTEATLRLVPLPRRRGIAMVYFPSVFACGEAVPAILSLRPSAAEIMDARFLALVRRHDSRVDAMLPPRTDTALLVEFEGDDEGTVAQKFAELERQLAGGPALGVVRARDAQETARLWAVRKSAVALVLRMPGPRRALPFIEDITVHPTEVAAYVDFLQRLFDRRRVEALMYGHVGDGNIHTRPLLDPKDASDLSTMQALFEEVFEYVRGVRGTMSGEHGDGLLRTPYVKDMYGDDIYSLFCQLKRTLDPTGLLNPGKKVALDETSPTAESRSLLKNLRYGPAYRTFPQRPVLHFSGEEYEREIEKCHGCAQCKSVVATTMCPTYKATRREQASPRAKANLLRAIISGRLDPLTSYGQSAVKAVTDYCIVCGMCAVECPSRVNIPKLMLEAKAKYRAVHRGDRTERLLGHPENTYRLMRRFAPLAGWALQNPTSRCLVELVTGIDRRRTLPSVARRTFADQARGARNGGRIQVAYFYDLYANYNDPPLAFQVVRVLEAHGLGVLLPPQRPSGIPEMLYGYAQEAARVARFNVESVLPAVTSGATLVSAEPTATFAFKVHYPDYAPTRESSVVAEATRDLGEFLVRYRSDHPDLSPAARALQGPNSPRPLRIAYHLPCHLKAQDIGSPGRDLLAEIPDVEVIDLAAGCCGMAGTFGLKRDTYDFSLEVGSPLFDRIREVAPDLIATECSTCRLQISEATGLRTVHPVTLLAQSYGCG